MGNRFANLALSCHLVAAPLVWNKGLGYSYKHLPLEIFIKYIYHKLKKNICFVSLFFSQ